MISSWVCIEPDIDKVSKAIDRYSNHVHFAYKTKSEINKRLLAKQLKNTTNKSSITLLNSKKERNRGRKSAIRTTYS